MKLLKELYDMPDPDFARNKERSFRDEEEERLNGEVRDSFLNDKTSMEDFDLDTVKKIISMAVSKKQNLKRQGDEMLQTWEEKVNSESYLDNDEFNKLFKQFEQLKDSTEAPLIKFNKLYSITKELSDGADDFDNWKQSDDATELKWDRKFKK